VDSITFARQSFLEACESLVLACELDNDVETHATIDKAIVACGVFNDVHGHLCPAHDEEFVEKDMSWFKLLRNVTPKCLALTAYASKLLVSWTPLHRTCKCT
jgi:hypothetical protein